MNIQIIGAGVVGQATGKGFSRLGHGVHFYDLNPSVASELRKQGYNAGSDLAIGERDVYFICVPEKVVEEAIDSWAMGSRLLVIRSTVPPGTARRLSGKYHAHVSSNPEFLREAVAEYEFLNPPGVIIGVCCHKHEVLLRSLYSPFRKPIYFVSHEVAELAKITVNGYLATQISYWNQVKLLADVLGINSHEVGMLASYCDDRVSEYGSRMHGKKYAGKCLPKDLQQLVDICQHKGVNAQLFEAVKAINDYYKAKEEHRT